MHKITNNLKKGDSVIYEFFDGAVVKAKIVEVHPTENILIIKTTSGKTLTVSAQWCEKIK